MDIRQNLGIKIESPYWDKAYNLAKREEEVPFWLTEEYIKYLNDECNVLRMNYERILEALPYVTENEDLLLLAKTLYYIIAEKKKAKEAFSFLEFPVAPHDAPCSLGYDFVGIFPILAHIKPSWEELEKRGIDKQIISDSLVTPDNLVKYTYERLGKYGLGNNEFLAYDVSVYINYLKIGRLRFEMRPSAPSNVRIFENDGKICILMNNVKMHRSGNVLGSYGCCDEEGSFLASFDETENEYVGCAVDNETNLAVNEKVVLPKKDWKPVLLPGDNIMRVHIPYGGRLDKEQCEDSYKRAREVFEQSYPEIKFTAFTIGCWMLSPVLREILPKESNIIEFQSKYNIFPEKSGAVDAFMYVFGFRGASVDEIDLQNLPETNSLMRGVKKKALEGKFVYECGGFFKW